MKYGRLITETDMELISMEKLFEFLLRERTCVSDMGREN